MAEASAVIANTSAAAHDDRPHTVLVVEGSRAMAAAVSASLGGIEGVDCESAHTMAEANRLIEQGSERFLVAVVCLNLPDAPNGEIVDTLLRAGLRVIVLTGNLDEASRTKMFGRGVADYVVKENVGGIEYVTRAVARMHRDFGITVLVVDDTQTFREYASHLLQQHGYRTLTAPDGEAGLPTLRAHPEIRVVVTDYLMPRMDGLTMVQEMRRLRSVDELAIIAISESVKAGVLANFLKSGASDFLRKPFCVEEFYCRIDQNVNMLRAVYDARRLANRDFLTGLHNRRYFFEHGGLMYDRAAAGDIRIIAAMIDIDRFKQVNDTYGHQIGDRALVAVAKTLTDQIGGSGIVARFGGEEFVFVGVLDRDGEPVACLEDLRRCVADRELVLGQQTLSITVSIGATLRLGNSLDEMLVSADRAVYRAKQQGRNQVVIL